MLFAGKTFASFLPLIAVQICIFASFSRSATTPKPKTDCALNSSSPYSYVIEIGYKRDMKLDELTDFVFGALITDKAALSTAFYFNMLMTAPDEGFRKSGGFKRFQVIAQNIYELSDFGRMYPCYQFNDVFFIHIHPKAKNVGQRMFYDFSVVELEKPFRLNGSLTAHPVMFFPNSAFNLLLQIRYVNIFQVTCAMPVPSYRYGKRLEKAFWTFNDRSDVRSIPFHLWCIDLLCDQDRSVAIIYPRLCENMLEKMLNGSMLCMRPGFISTIYKEDAVEPRSEAGIPLVCNGSTLGISANVKERHRLVDSEYLYQSHDFFFVVTLLRIYPWLIKNIIEFSPTVNPQTMNPKDIKSEKYDEPHREPTPSWGRDEFYKLHNYGIPNFFLAPRRSTSRKPSSLSGTSSTLCGAFWKTFAGFVVLRPNFLINFVFV